MKTRAVRAGTGITNSAAVAARPGAALAVVAAWLLTAATALAADPTASPAGGDVRTTPAAPGLVGEPLLALAGVLVVGLLAAVVTLVAVRLSSRS